ncbi:hypothetical protein F0562_007351 [Nyssa sinensis]|uniref:Uncharacterized protein n=1 Tax=Nyssa sinensis TaxID=561372 RepID=A0A5J5A6E0_9ASTE|nr:hypothetical protein F0562_007351 [Nyssa sinensis]
MESPFPSCRRCFCYRSVVVFIISGNFSSLICFAGSKSEYTVPIVELQTKVTSPTDRFRAVLYDKSTTLFVNLRLRNQTVIRKDERVLLEQGLARARASIRKAATSRNMSSARDDSEVPAGDIYRNPRGILSELRGNGKEVQSIRVRRRRPTHDT